jgi:hypothetical protein
MSFLHPVNIPPPRIAANGGQAAAIDDAFLQVDVILLQLAELALQVPDFLKAGHLLGLRRRLLLGQCLDGQTNHSQNCQYTNRMKESFPH